jgi:SprT-like family
MTTTKTEINLESTIRELNKAFKMINETYFDNALEDVIISVHTSTKKNVLGWFTPAKIWDAGDRELHEINLVSENLRRGKMQILQTLMHEMIHLYNHQNGIKDTSRGNAYHNKKFLHSALMFGFEFLHDKPDSKIGYSMITLTKATYDTLDSFDLEDSAFDLARKSFAGKEKKKTTWKWTCSCLQPQIVRTTKPELRAICPDCKSWFECQD